MGRYIVKIKDMYLEWSSIVDAPVTYGMTLEVFNAYYLEEYGRRDFETELPERLERVERTGCSARDGHTVDSFVSYNRAGPNETCLTLDEIYQRFCVDRDG